MWGDDYKKVSYFSPPIYSIDKGRLESFQKLYFTTSNAVVCINAALEKLQMDVLLDKTFTQRGLAQFNPERITHVLEFKPIGNNTHFIFNNVQEKEESGIVFQNPGARYDRRGSYCAYLLNQMLESEKNEEGVNASYKSNNYFGTFSITVEVKDHKYKATLDKTTGAGDLYAAGFLYGYSQGHSLETCGKLASLAAAEIISHVGARPQAQLAQLAYDKRLI